MRIVIVGGGSAGWITASTLLSRLKNKNCPPYTLTVIESPDTPRVGVGEATIPTFRNMMADFGIPESTLFTNCEATIKHAIRFEGWTGEQSEYSHPFHRFQDPIAANAAQRWMAGDRTRPFSELVSAQDAMIRQHKAPRPLSGKDYSGVVPYAYHLDADLFAEVLAAHCMSHQVDRLFCHLDSVERDGETGNVVAVIGSDGQRVVGDFFIDCSGFRHFLADDPTPGAGWLDQSHHLLCDRAVTLRVPREPREKLRPFTSVKALEAGWSWDIGLQSRRGRGYVYASSHSDPDRAEQLLRAEEGPRADALEARHLSFKVGRRITPWQSNVVSIGLAAGFLEPLESTGLYFAQTAARLLSMTLPTDPNQTTAAPLSATFNKRFTQLHDRVLDFILLHYALAKRPDPFWQDASDVRRLTDSLKDLLDLWRIRTPEILDIEQGLSPFNHLNYEFILMGNEWLLDAATNTLGRSAAHPSTMAVLAVADDLDAFMERLLGSQR